jgi:RNA polymerase primary sigma factor
MKEHDYSWEDQDPDQMSDLVSGEYDSSPDIEDWAIGLDSDSDSDSDSDETSESAESLETFEDPTSDAVLQKDELARMASAIDEILGGMHPREAGVVRSRLGIGEAKQKIPEHISEEFGISLERIRQIESKFMSKLRAAHQRGAFKEFLEPN